jgi:hypothetical protein
MDETRPSLDEAIEWLEMPKGRGRAAEVAERDADEISAVPAED